VDVAILFVIRIDHNKEKRIDAEFEAYVFVIPAFGTTIAIIVIIKGGHFL